MSELRRPIESGVPDSTQFMHPVLRDNYGRWAWHDRPRPGVLRHVSDTGVAMFTVKAGTQRQMDVHTIRKLADIADEFCDGYIRFTIRSAVEFMTPKEENVQPLIDRLEAEGFPVGGTGNSVGFISHTQGWLHCDIPGTDASGVVKALMD
ncbi:MAG: dissimilatory-type sulfite reductase subunit beta, partial [Magnetospirillum sp.]|nr:dissimilatory-type sulfite reductase subunit beta [Magnetospirillum sp.]